MESVRLDDRISYDVLDADRAVPARFPDGPRESPRSPNGLRVRSSNWSELVRAVAEVDVAAELLVARQGVVRALHVSPGSSPGRIKLSCDNEATPAQLRAREAWLGVERR